MDELPQPLCLLDALALVPDPRSRQGRSYSLASILALVVTAMLCGYRSYRAIAQWGRLYNHLTPLLGFTKPKPNGPGYRTPCFSELATVLAALDAAAFEAVLRRWILSQGVTTLTTRTVALDGKTVRGSRTATAPAVHLLAAYCREVEAVLAQLRVPDATNEHKTALELLGVIPLKGTVITADAAFCQRDLCAAIVAEGGDYLVAVKDNQPALKQGIATGFARSFSPGGARRAAPGGSGGGEPEQGAWPGGDPPSAGHRAAECVSGLAGSPAGLRRGAGADRGE